MSEEKEERERGGVGGQQAEGMLSIWRELTSWLYVGRAANKNVNNAIHTLARVNYVYAAYAADQQSSV